MGVTGRKLAPMIGDEAVMRLDAVGEGAEGEGMMGGMDYLRFVWIGGGLVYGDIWILHSSLLPFSFFNSHSVHAELHRASLLTPSLLPSSPLPTSPQLTAALIGALTLSPSFVAHSSPPSPLAQVNVTFTVANNPTTSYGGG